MLEHNKEIFFDFLGHVYGIHNPFRLGELDGECPYDSDEIDREMSFTVYLDNRVWGRVLRWTGLDGEIGWLLEWDYWVPINPTSSATWLSFFTKQDFRDFVFLLGLYYKAFNEFAKISGLRNYIFPPVITGYP